MIHARPAPTRVALGALALLALAVGGCTSKSGGGDGIAVTASDDSCDVAATELPSGSATFTVTNRGGDVTETYVYTLDDEIMGEVENIGPGTSRDLTVDLGPGLYEVVCKPGMTGDGIATPITVTDAATGSTPG
jgi:iron uptake system component EfeO